MCSPARSTQRENKFYLFRQRCKGARVIYRIVQRHFADDLDVRVVRAGKQQPGAADDGTQLFTALDRELAEVPRQRLAGVVMITDG